MARPSGKSRAHALVKAMDDERVRIVGNANVKPVKVLPTGIDCLDVALQAGGYPWGLITILHGAEGTFKTTAALHAVVSCQKLKGTALYLDYERKLNFPYAQAIGVDMDELVHVTPRSIEAGFAILEQAVDTIREIDENPNTKEEEKDKPILLVWDSIHAARSGSSFEVKAAARTKKNANKYEDAGWEQQAKAYSDCIPKFVPTLADTRAVFLAISQVRIKIDGGFVKEKVAVGHAWNFYNAVTIKVSTKAPKARMGRKKIERTGDIIEALVSKNQIGAPNRVTQFPMVYGQGAVVPVATLHAAEAVGLAERGGAWYKVQIGGKEYKFQGLDGIVTLAEKQPEVFAALRAEIRKRIRGET